MAASRRAELTIVGLVAVAVAVVIVFRLVANGSSPKIVFHPVAQDYRPQPDRTFFWGTNIAATFSPAQDADLVRSRGVVVISPSLDGYNLDEQERQARELHKLEPGVRTFFYFNTKHYLDEKLYPKYLHGFDPAMMALHGTDGALVRFHATRRDPHGSGYYVDESSPAWRAFYLRTAARVLAAGQFTGIAMDSLRPLTAATDQAAVTRVRPGRVSEWNRGQLTLLRQVRSKLSDKLVLYNGISQTVPGQTDRNLGPLDIADGTLNEEFCLQHGQPNVPFIRNDLGLMATAAAQHKFVLEKVNYDLAHVLTDAQLASVRERYGDFCLGAFLLGYQPGSAYFDFSDGYGIDQLDTLPPELELDLGRPTSAAKFDGDVGTRGFERGRVYVNLGDQPAHVVLDAPGIRVADHAVVKRYRAGGTLTLGANSAAFLVTA